MMHKVVVVSRDGTEAVVEAEPGLSVMEIIRDNGVDVVGLCGGCCSCGTCHVYVDPESTDSALLPPLDEDEDYLLDGSTAREATSRLACQIVFDPTMDGLRVTVAPEE